MLLDVGMWEVSDCYGRPIIIFLLNKIGFALWPDTSAPNILLTKILHFDSEEFWT